MLKEQKEIGMHVMTVGSNKRCIWHLFHYQIYSM